MEVAQIQLAVTLIVALGGAVWVIGTYLNSSNTKRISSLETRVSSLERDSVTKAHLDSFALQITQRYEAMTTRIEARLDELYALLIKK